jgi:hypothetical protein
VARTLIFAAEGQLYAALNYVRAALHSIFEIEGMLAVWCERLLEERGTFVVDGERVAYELSSHDCAALRRWMAVVQGHVTAVTAQADAVGMEGESVEAPGDDDAWQSLSRSSSGLLDPQGG